MLARWLVMALLFASVAFMTGCTTTPPPEIPSVVSVSIDQGDQEIAAGGSVALTATVTTTAGANTDVTWSISDLGVATVSDDGVVTGVAEGEAVVTATSDFDDQQSANVTITVIASDPPEVVGVTIQQGDQMLQVGEVLALSALVEVAGGASTAVSWATDDPEVVQVSDGGVVTGVAEGVGVVTATSDADPDWAASVTITVVAVVTVDAVAVSIEPVNVTLTPGQSEGFSASVVGTDDGGVLWSVTGGAIERSGATAVYTAPEAAGTYFVTATSVVNPARSATSAVVVTSDDPDDEPVAARVEIVSDASVVLAGIGESARFVAAVVRSDGSLDLDARVTWESSDPSAVEIDADGVVTAREAVGSATIRAHYDALPAARGSVLVARVADGARFVPRHLIEAVEQPAIGTSQLFGQSGALERVRVPNIYLLRRFVEGDKIASGPEDGLLHRIVRIEEAPLGGLWWWVEEIQMTDYFEDADFSAEGEPVTVEAMIDEGVMTLSTLSSAGVRTLAEARIIDTDRLKCTLSDGGDADIDFAGTRFATTFQLVPVYNLRIRWFSIEEFRLGARLEMGFDAASGTLSVDASVGAAIACELTLASLKVPLPVHAGPFTFAFNPSLKFRMEHGWEYDAGSFTFTGPAGSAGYEIEAGLLCSGGSGCGAYSSEKEHGTFVPFEMGFELNAEYSLESRAALVLGAGVTANLGRTTLVGVDVFEGQLYTALRLGTTAPLMPEIAGYRGPNWDLVGGVRADLLLRVHAGDLQRLLRRVGLSGSASTEPLTLYDETFFEVASPDPTVAVDPASVSSGLVTFTTTVPARSTERLVGARVEFWGAPEGSGIASLLASGTLSEAGTATATWTPDVDDNGSYRVAALVYDEVLEGFSFAYGSSERAALTIAIGDDGDPGTVAVSLSPSSAVLQPGATRAFTATVTGASDTSVTWTASCGSFSDEGNPATYVAPTQTGSCFVTATSVEDVDASATATVNVAEGPAGALTVTALNVDGAPTGSEFGRVEIRLLQDNVVRASVTADAAGVAVFDEVPVGSYTLEVWLVYPPPGTGPAGPLRDEFWGQDVVTVSDDAPGTAVFIRDQPYFAGDLTFPASVPVGTPFEVSSSVANPDASDVRMRIVLDGTACLEGDCASLTGYPGETTSGTTVRVAVSPRDAGDFRFYFFLETRAAGSWVVTDQVDRFQFLASATSTPGEASVLRANRSTVIRNDTVRFDWTGPVDATTCTLYPFYPDTSGRVDFSGSSCSSGLSDVVMTRIGELFPRIVFDGDSRSFATVALAVSNSSPPVIASFSASGSSVTRNDTVRFSWSASDPEGEPLSCTLYPFYPETSGRVAFSGSSCLSGQSDVVVTRVGELRPRLVMDDGNGGVAYATVPLGVADPDATTSPNAPVVESFGVESLGSAGGLSTNGERMRFTWTASDPDGDALSCRIHFRWPRTGERQDFSGTSCTVGSAWHTYNFAGPAVVMLQLTDGVGNTTRAYRAFNVNVSDDPVITGFSATPSTVAAGDPVDFAWTAFDPDGQSLQCRFRPFGSASTSGSQTYSGSACLDGFRTYTYTSRGTYQPDFFVTNGTGGRAIRVATVVVE